MAKPRAARLDALIALPGQHARLRRLARRGLAQLGQLEGHVARLRRRLRASTLVAASFPERERHHAAPVVDRWRAELAAAEAQSMVLRQALREVLTTLGPGGRRP